MPKGALASEKVTPVIDVKEQSVLVRIVDNMPIYVFSGIWTGRDVNRIINHFRKAYRIHQGTIRKADVKKEI